MESVRAQDEQIAQRRGSCNALDPATTIVPSASLFPGDWIRFTSTRRTLWDSRSKRLDLQKFMSLDARVHTILYALLPMISKLRVEVNPSEKSPLATSA